MYNPHQKREAFLLTNFKKAMATLGGIRNPDCQVTDYYGNPKVWERESRPVRVFQVTQDGEKGSRWMSILLPREPNYLIEG